MSSQGSNWLRVAWHGTSSWLSCHVHGQISRLVIKSQDVWASSKWFCGLECSAAASEEKSRSSVRRRPQVIQVYNGRRYFYGGGCIRTLDMVDWWLTQIDRGITWNRQRMVERMYEFCWVLPFSTDYLVETGNSPWPPRERMVRASISEQPGQSTCVEKVQQHSSTAVCTRVFTAHLATFINTVQGPLARLKQN